MWLRFSLFSQMLVWILVFMGCHKTPEKNHMQSVHQTTAVYIKVFTTEQNHVRVLMEWGIMLLICRSNIKYIYRLLQSLLLWGEKSSEVRNADVNEAGGDVTFHSNRCSCGHAGLEIWLRPGWSKGHTSNRKWHGGGWTGSARPSSCFLTCAFPFPRLPRFYVGSREDGGRKQNNKVSQWPELTWEKCWLTTYTLVLKFIDHCCPLELNFFCHFETPFLCIWTFLINY